MVYIVIGYAPIIQLELYAVMETMKWLQLLWKKKNYTEIFVLTKLQSINQVNIVLFIESPRRTLRGHPCLLHGPSAELEFSIASVTGWKSKKNNNFALD